MRLGTHHTDAAREKMSKAHLGTHPTEAAREKLREAHNTSEFCEKIRKA